MYQRIAPSIFIITLVSAVACDTMKFTAADVAEDGGASGTMVAHPAAGGFTAGSSAVGGASGDGGMPDVQAGSAGSADGGVSMAGGASGDGDAGEPDAGLPDATQDVVEVDADEPDVSVPDADVSDVTVPDADLPDATQDVVEVDADEPDVSVPDADVSDVTVPDAGEPDAGLPDASQDADEPDVENGPECYESGVRIRWETQGGSPVVSADGTVNGSGGSDLIEGICGPEDDLDPSSYAFECCFETEWYAGNTYLLALFYLANGGYSCGIEDCLPHTAYSVWINGNPVTASYGSIPSCGIQGDCPHMLMVYLPTQFPDQ